MFSGRHLVCIGVLACTGLASVKSSQEQVRLGYELADCESKLRRVQRALVNERAELQKLHSPANILPNSVSLTPHLGPQSGLSLYRSPRPGAVQQQRPASRTTVEQRRSH